MKYTWEFLKKTLKKNSIVVLGLSGGPDSMCLFDILLKLKEEYHLTIICAHVNHHVREQSDAEEIFVKQKVEENHCIFDSITLNIQQNTNFEAVARKKRYAFFKEIVKKYHASLLLTAHHGDDLVETILMHITRGSSLAGYAGFKKITHFADYDLIRPLVYVTKEDILIYCKRNHISYCIDQSNESDKHTRNRYRKYILPFLKKENKNIHLKYLKLSEELENIEAYLQKKTEDALTKTMSFGKVNLRELNKLEPLIKKRIIEYILKEEYQDNLENICDAHVDNILKLCESKKPNVEINLPLNKILLKEFDTLFFKHKKSLVREEYILEDCVKLSENEKIVKIDNTDIVKSNYLLRLNSKEITLPLKIRTRKREDAMEVKNMQGTKKINKIFIDEKVPMSKRDTYPIVTDSNGTILWIPGLKKSKFDKNIDEFYDIIYKYEMSEENEYEK